MGCNFRAEQAGSGRNDCLTFVSIFSVTTGTRPRIRDRIKDTRVSTSNRAGADGIRTLGAGSLFNVTEVVAAMQDVLTAAQWYQKVLAQE